MILLNLARLQMQFGEIGRIFSKNGHSWFVVGADRPASGTDDGETRHLRRWWPVPARHGTVATLLRLLYLRRTLMTDSIAATIMAGPRPPSVGKVNRQRKPFGERRAVVPAAMADMDRQ